MHIKHLHIQTHTHILKHTNARKHTHETHEHARTDNIKLACVYIPQNRNRTSASNVLAASIISAGTYEGMIAVRDGPKNALTLNCKKDCKR